MERIWIEFYKKGWKLYREREVVAKYEKENLRFLTLDPEITRLATEFVKNPSAVKCFHTAEHIKHLWTYYFESILYDSDLPKKSIEYIKETVFDVYQLIIKDPENTNASMEKDLEKFKKLLAKLHKQVKSDNKKYFDTMEELLVCCCTLREYFIKVGV